MGVSPFLKICRISVCPVCGRLVVMLMCVIFQGYYYPALALMMLLTEDAMENLFQALNAEDDMVQDSSSPLTVNPAKYERNGNVPSVEDVDWADSCLVNNAEDSDPDWTLVLDALAETLSSRSDAPADSASQRDALTGVDIAIARTSEETEPLVSVDTIAFNSASTLAKNKSEKNSDGYPIDDQNDALPLGSTYDSFFLPTYKEDTREVNDFVAEFDSEFPVYAMEQRNQSIFKEWDIDIPDEEDELTKQLDKILSGGNTSQVDPPGIDDTGLWEASRGKSMNDPLAGSVDLSIDDLISGVSDLSLNGYSA